MPGVRSLLWSLALLPLLAGASLGAPARPLTAEAVNAATFQGEPRKAAKAPDPFIVKAQVLLARRSISPGEIDGMDGENYRKAIAQFRRQNNLGPGDRMDEQAWAALGGPQAGAVLTEYVFTKADAKADHPRRIPRDFARQAKMKRLDYTSGREMLAERFHMSERLLAALNPKARYRTVDEKIMVVALDRQPPEGPVERIEAVKATGMLVVYGKGDAILASYPATIGSEDTPSPEGEYKVKRIARDPPYNYDPEKNFQQGQNRKKLVLPPGPNNPAGSVWIALSKPTFGIHGTPEPSKVSKTSSHGCVRLTNWDVEELAGLVKPGVAMRFVD
ncbi:L,D-transpeptidase family protein [Aquabacter cavernae]|uniref:L,D-transpeptidase family protein n=1 Tax=Aquabacter cavernae TaxID=2496029 RepID=UPI000F8D0836|nr:L,D-transpeptidase [Aquabacter cavernae]